MSYNKRNKLERIQMVQETARKYLLPGVTVEYVFKTHIHPIFKISRGVFFRYMKIPVQQELEKLNNSNAATATKSKFKQLSMELPE